MNPDLITTRQRPGISKSNGPIQRSPTFWSVHIAPHLISCHPTSFHPIWVRYEAIQFLPIGRSHARTANWVASRAHSVQIKRGQMRWDERYKNAPMWRYERTVSAVRLTLTWSRRSLANSVSSAISLK